MIYSLIKSQNLWGWEVSETLSKGSQRQNCLRNNTVTLLSFHSHSLTSVYLSFPETTWWMITQQIAWIQYANTSVFY